MHTLEHQFELGSDAWLEEARRVLGQWTANADVAFVTSARLTDAPPHLELAKDVVEWRFACDGSQVDVTRAFDPAADIVIEADYQAALMIAQSIGAGSAPKMASAERAVAEWFGEDAYRRRERGKLASPARALLDRLHDHLGRRTVENPDLHHRAERQGLLGHIRDMERDGYAVIENAITDDEADLLRDETLRALSTHEHPTMQWMLYHGEVFERVVMNPFFMTLVDASLGRGAVVASISAIERGPGKGFIPLHSDYVHIPEPYPEFSLTGVGVWAMEDWTVSAGPTYLVPGSHRKRRGPRRGEAMDGIPIEMPKGSVVYFQHGVWHWQGDRTDPGKRVTLHSHFNRGILRSLEPKRVDVQMMNRNPPRLGEALGEDDWFDKIDADGRDQVRFGHMLALNHFNDQQKARILDSASDSAAEPAAARID